MSEYTPGPWKVYQETGEILAADEQVVLGQVYGADVYPCLDDDDEGIAEWAAECHANARLIAAAPELLAALEAMIIDDDWGLSVRSDLKLAAAAKAAIARARGE